MRCWRTRSLPSPVVIHLDVPADVLVGRMVSRRQCSQCGRMFNVLSQRPKVDGRCDDDGAPLTTRKDDREDVIRERLRTYEEVTRPVVAHYPSDRYFQISGDRSTSYIFEEITRILEALTDKPECESLKICAASALVRAAIRCAASATARG